MFLASDLKQKGQPSCLCRHSKPPMSRCDFGICLNLVLWSHHSQPSLAVFGFKLKRQRWRCWQSPYDLCLKFNLIPWCFSFKVFSPGSSEGRKIANWKVRGVQLTFIVWGSFKKLAHFLNVVFQHTYESYDLTTRHHLRSFLLSSEIPL